MEEPGGMKDYVEMGAKARDTGTSTLKNIAIVINLVFRVSLLLSAWKEGLSNFCIRRMRYR